MELAGFCLRRIRILTWRNLVISLTALLVSTCASTQTATVGMRSFVYDGEDYRIRSISSPVEGESRNELISDSFIAVDLDQDQFIDQIVQGAVSLQEAQQIYDFCLATLADENKLRQIESEERIFRETGTNFEYELKSFRSGNNDPFNEFRIVDKRNTNTPLMNVYRDFEADGILDKQIMGNVSLENAQHQYTELIRRGLQKKKLSSEGKTILVK